ncbi:hypothetical protein [Natronorubrum texcoconense]|uniref:Uncharacterized protein n=1 Tax=Natronorubrum texcoconense TaxID=1095776 RepID=A0A1G8VND3_9EURY|nr:hypothetical protein [Natronorubrum texcoconense]SDJ67417.1 hypothetical protein SAMN04515672_1419 [Natronorubrum texcoconense]
MKDSSDNTRSRRTVLKGASTGVVGSIAALSSVSSAQASTDDEEPEWTNTYIESSTDEMFGTEYLLEQSLAIEYFGDDDAFDDTVHKYRVAGSTVARMEDEDGGWQDPYETGGDVGNAAIDEHTLSIDINSNDIKLWDSNDPEYLGGFPVFEDGGGVDYSEVAEYTIKAAVNKHPYGRAAFTAHEIYSQLQNIQDASGPDRSREFEWSYSYDEVVADASHYYEFMIEDDDICKQEGIQIYSTASNSANGEVEVHATATVPQLADPGLCW